MEEEELKYMIGIDEVARFFKVSRTTIRNWTKKGKIPSYRHPCNNRRLYKKKDIEAIKNNVKLIEEQNHT